MSYLTTKKTFPKQLPSVTVHVGEESELMVVVLEPGDPDFGFPVMPILDFYIAAAEVMQSPPPIPGPNGRKVALSVIGEKVGTTSLDVSSFPTHRGDPLKHASTQVIVTDVADKDVDLYYWGKYVLWRRSLPPSAASAGQLVFSATSGTTPIASAQVAVDIGPVPEGKYRFLAQIDPLQGSVDQANKLLAEGDAPGKGPFHNFRQGIQFLPIGGNGPVNPAWGTMRVRLEPLARTKVPTRGGFYLHNSHKGYTSGCIEMGRTDKVQDFFSALLEYAISPQAKSKPYLILKVSYRDADTSTLGNTKY
jgi:hypothetical protein